MCFVHQQTISEQFLVEFSLLSGQCAFGGYWIGIFERVLCHRFGIQQILKPLNALLILKEGARWLSVHAEDLADSRLVFFAFFFDMTSNKKHVKKHTFGCLLYILMLMIFGCTTYIQSYNVTNWGVNIFRDSRLCWSSFVICWKELTWTSIPKSKSLPDRLENNNDADDEKVIGKEKKVTRKWIYMESFDMIFFSFCAKKSLTFDSHIW